MHDTIELDTEKEIANKLIDASERQPVRWDIYIKHINYLQDKADSYKKIAQRVINSTEETAKVNYHFCLDKYGKK